MRRGVLAALDRLGLWPELYAVREDGELEPAPLANRVQAWTVGARWALEQGWDGRRADRLLRHDVVGDPCSRVVPDSVRLP